MTDAAQWLVIYVLVITGICAIAYGVIVAAVVTGLRVHYNYTRKREQHERAQR